MSVSERLREFVDFQKKSITQLSKEIGVSQNGLNAAVNGKTQPSSKMLIPLSELGLSIDWLYTGEGSMIRERRENLINKEKTPIHIDQLINNMLKAKEETILALNTSIKNQEKLINKQENELEQLQKELAEFKEFIEQRNLKPKDEQ